MLPIERAANNSASTYCGLALQTRITGEYVYVQGERRRSKKQISIRGLNKDHNHDLKGLFKAAATPRQAQFTLALPRRANCRPEDEGFQVTLVRVVGQEVLSAMAILRQLTERTHCFG